MFDDNNPASVPGSTASALASATGTAGLAIVTGGSRGIGRATCLLLAARGYDVAINFRAGEDAAKAVADQISVEKAAQPTRYSGRPFVVRADVSQEDEVKRMFDVVEAEFGSAPTALVNNAGILGSWDQGDFTELDKDTLDKVFATNVYGPFFCCREFVRRASTKRGGKGGAIVNVSSGAAYIGRPLFYAMSKGAIDSMMAGLSKSLPPEGIRINSVAPGMTETDMVSQEMADSAMKHIPMRRVGKPEEIAEAICFLLSGASSYCSGSKIRIAGGRP